MSTLLMMELQCPVCYGLLTSSPPVRQCSRGHVTCATCAERVGSCSLCRLSFLPHSPTFVNNLLEVMPRPCKFSDRGCDKICLSNNLHEIYCSFRVVWCRVLNCEELVQVRDLVKHYEEDHQPSEVVMKRAKGEFIFESSRMSGRKHVPVFVEGTLFHLYLHTKTVTDHCLRVFLEAHFIEKPTVEHFVNIKLERGDFVAMGTLSPFVNQGELSGSLEDLFSQTLDKNETLCMKISPKLFHHLLDDSQKLRVSFSFFKK